MHAQAFLAHLRDVLPQTWGLNAPRSWSAWTGHMATHLHAVATAAGMRCRCEYPHEPTDTQQAHTREALFDFCWYRGTSRYMLPEVVIEHENSGHTGDFLYDLWKLMAAHTPLRVMIGYTPTMADWAERLQAINDAATRAGWVFPDTSEDVVLVGTNSMPTPRQFAVFRRPVGCLHFVDAGTLDHPAPPPGPRELLDDALRSLQARLPTLAPMCERDVVWTIQQHITRRIVRDDLPYVVFNDYPILEGNRRGRSADLVITRAGQPPAAPVDMAVEWKYEPDHIRGGRDMLAHKFPVVGWMDVVKDVARVRKMVDTGSALQAIAICIDASGHFQERLDSIPAGSRWEA